MGGSDPDIPGGGAAVISSLSSYNRETGFMCGSVGYSMTTRMTGCEVFKALARDSNTITKRRNKSR